MPPIRGLLVYGVTTMAQGPDDSVPEVSTDPVYLSADYIESAISDGTLQAGVLRNVTVQPPVSEWPERWRHLA